jgi:hypothetical protein
MVAPLDIALAAHEICLTRLIDSGLSKPHDFPQHLDTGGWYARAFNEAGLEDVTGKEVVNSIFGVVNWDFNSPWPGHPDPQLVIERYKEQQND